MSDVDITLGPGKYFLGDISVSMPRNFGKWDAEGRQNGEIEVGDNKFVVCATDSGNGAFYDGEHRQYPVKNNNIGLVPEALWEVPESTLKARGLVFIIHERVVFDVEDGIFWITADDNETIEIDTEADYDADWEEWLMDEDEQL